MLIALALLVSVELPEPPLEEEVRGPSCETAFYRARGPVFSMIALFFYCLQGDAVVWR